MIRNLCVSLLVLCSMISTGQVLPEADFKGAKKISVNKTYSFLLSPKGYGQTQEFPVDANRSDWYFKEERNTVWLLLDIPFNGILTFEIKPHSIADDYDWMLFNFTPQLEQQIKDGVAKLVRSNNSRNNKSIKGQTGINNDFTNPFSAPGPGKSFSSAIFVKSGQKLALLIDNIYDSGDGFDFTSTLKPQVLSTRLLTGSVADLKTNLPLGAKIVCEDDSTGYRFAETTASKDGKYSMQIPENRPLNLTATFPDYIFQTHDLIEEKKFTEHHFKLSPIEEASKLLLFNIHFTPDKDQIRLNSEPELERLTSLLKEQKDFDVRIIGHTNNNPFADARYLQKLSFNRAIAVKQYLVKNGVSEKRISCIGVGGKSPIVVTKNAEEGWKNLRVEVVVSKTYP